MPTVSIPLTAVQVLSARPTTPVGQPAQLQLATTARVLLAVSLAQVPSTATVSSAVLTVKSATGFSGSRAVSVARALSAVSTAATWNTQPGGGPAVDTVTVTNAGAGTAWSLDVTSLVQSWVSRSVPNYGMRLTSSNTTAGVFAGASAASGRPVLVVTYTLTPVAPSSLRPQGFAVSLPKPMLTANVATDTTSIQVQVDASANASAPAFDSGEVASTGGSYDLASPPAPVSGSTPTFTALADGASTQHRWRVKNSSGLWSEWSAWATFSRRAWAALTVTSPASTVEDPSPTAAATFAGSLTSWRIQFVNTAGVVVSDSQWQPAGTIVHTSTGSVGSAGTARFYVRDAYARGAMPNDPDYLLVSQPFTVSPSGTPAALTSVSVTPVTYASPVTRVTVTRAQIPDELVIYRAGVQVARLPGSVFTGSGPYTAVWDDYTVGMNVAVTYSARAVVNGAFSNAAAAAAFTPTCSGIWLLDPDTLSGVAVETGEDQDQTQPELAALSRPIGGTGAVVRRRLARAPREGTVSGVIVDALGVTASASESLLRTWVDPDAGYDAGHVFRLVLGNLNDPVIVGDLELSEQPANTLGQRIIGVGFSWWWQG